MVGLFIFKIRHVTKRFIPDCAFTGVLCTTKCSLIFRMELSASYAFPSTYLEYRRVAISLYNPESENVGYVPLDRQAFSVTFSSFHRDYFTCRHCDSVSICI